MLILLPCLQTPASTSSEPGAAIPVCQLSQCIVLCHPTFSQSPSSSHHEPSQGAELPKNWQQPPPPAPVCVSLNTPTFIDTFAVQRTQLNQNNLLTTLRTLQNRGCCFQSQRRYSLAEVPWLSRPTKLDSWTVNTNPLYQKTCELVSQTWRASHLVSREEGEACAGSTSEGRGGWPSPAGG